MDAKPEVKTERNVVFTMTEQEAKDIAEILSSYTADELLTQLNSTNKRHFETENDKEFQRINQSAFSFSMQVLKLRLP